MKNEYLFGAILAIIFGAVYIYRLVSAKKDAETKCEQLEQRNEEASNTIQQLFHENTNLKNALNGGKPYNSGFNMGGSPSY